MLLKETTKKISSQEKAFLNFHRLLITNGFPFMKVVPYPLAKTVLIQI